MFIVRHMQTILTTLIQRFPTVMVTGARQVGKSTLLKHNATESISNYEYGANGLLS